MTIACSTSKRSHLALASTQTALAENSHEQWPIGFWYIKGCTIDVCGDFNENFVGTNILVTLGYMYYMKSCLLFGKGTSISFGLILREQKSRHDVEQLFFLADVNDANEQLQGRTIGRFCKWWKDTKTLRNKRERTPDVCFFFICCLTTLGLRGESVRKNMCQTQAFKMEDAILSALASELEKIESS